MTDTAATEATSPLSTRLIWLSLAAIVLCNIGFGLAFGGLAPLISLTLENRGVPEGWIGANSSMTAVGIVCIALVLPRLIARFHPGVLLGVSLVLLVSMVSTLPHVYDLRLWFAIRFVQGIAIGIPWVVTETWMNAIAPARYRGRVTALYGTAMAGGFAAGPIVLTFVGTEGADGYYWCAGAIGIAILSTMVMSPYAPRLRELKKTRLSGFASAAPTIFAAALLAGALDTAVFSLMPIWGLRMGLTETAAVMAVSIFIAGNLIMQIPVGWLGDNWGRRQTMLLCGAVASIGPLAVTLLTGSGWPSYVALFLWGGFAWALYTVSLAMIGERYQGAMLTAANAAFILTFECANIAVPPVAGYAMDLWEPHGFMAVLGGLSLAFTVLVALRGWMRRRRGLAPDEPVGATGH